MNIIICAAMDQELNPILNKSNIKKTWKIANVSIYEAILFDKKVILYKTNVSRTNAALATAIVLYKYRNFENIIINVGSSGAGRTSQKILKTVISNKLNYSENKVDGFEKGQVPHMPVIYQTDKKLQNQFKKLIINNDDYEIGNFVCSESFLSNKEIYEQAINSNPLEISSCDMESTAIAQVCYVFDVPFIGIRTISDNIFNQEQNTVDQFKYYINHVYKGYLSLLEKYLRKY